MTRITADQAKQSATEAILLGIQSITAAMSNACQSEQNDASNLPLITQQFEASLAHLRQMEAVAHRLIEVAFSDDEKESEAAKPTESDDAFRSRLQKIVGRASVHTVRLERAIGPALDEIGGYFSTVRR